MDEKPYKKKYSASSPQPSRDSKWTDADQKKLKSTAKQFAEICRSHIQAADRKYCRVYTNTETWVDRRTGETRTKKHYRKKDPKNELTDEDICKMNDAIKAVGPQINGILRIMESLSKAELENATEKELDLNKLLGVPKATSSKSADKKN